MEPFDLSDEERKQLLADIGALIDAACRWGWPDPERTPAAFRSPEPDLGDLAAIRPLTDWEYRAWINHRGAQMAQQLTDALPPLSGLRFEWTNV